MTKFLNNADIKGYIAQTAVTSYLIKADSTGRLVAAIAGTDYQAPTTALLPSGGTVGQILAKIDGTNYNTEWIDNFAQQLKHDVKLGATIAKGKAVYVSSANGTNMIVSAASNASEATSSKTLGLLETGGVTNDIVKVVTEGLLAGLDTSTATAGDPVWLGTSGNLIFGLANKPVAPAHMVFIGIVTRAQSVNGEIFIKVQNGFELDELHNVALSSVADGQGLFYESATSLWKNKTIAAVLGYTPANDSAVVHLAGTETITGVKTFSSVINASTLSLNGGTLAGNNIVSMRSNPTGGQFRIEKSDGSLSAYPFYIGVDGTALAYYYNASGALKVLLHTDGTSYFGNSLSVGYSTYAATSYSLDVNGSAQITSTLQVGGNLYGVGATFSNAVTAASIIKSGGTSSQFLKADGSVDSNAYITSSSLSAYLPLIGGTLTGDLTLSGTNPRLYFTDTDNNPDYFISNTDGTFTVYDVTNSIGRFKIYSGGNAEFTGALSGTSATFSGTVVVASPFTIKDTNPYIQWKNASDTRLGYIQHATNLVMAADSGNIVLNTASGSFTLASGGAATFNSSLSATNITLGSGTIGSIPSWMKVITTDATQSGIGAVYNNKAVYLYNNGSAIKLDAYDYATSTGLNIQIGGNGGKIIASNGQVQFTTYTSATSYTGTAAGYLAFDSSGNVITVGSVASTDNTKLPLAGGTTTGIVTFGGSNNTTDNVRFQNTDGNYAYIRQTAASNSNNVWYDGTLGATMWYAWDNPGSARTAGVYTQHIFGTGRGTSNEAVTINRGAISGTNSSGTTTYSISRDGSASLAGILSFSNTTGNKIDFYHDTTGSGDRYGVQVQNSELRIHSGAGGTSTGGITFGKSTTTTFTESMRIRNDGNIQISGIQYSTYNTATGRANLGFNTAKTVIGNYHIQNGSGPGNDNSNQAAITFQGGTASEAQAGIYVLNNGSYGTSMGFATTESYATGPQIFMTATNGGVVNFPRARPTYAGNTILDAANYSSYALPLNGNWVGNTGMNDQKLYLRTNGDNNHYLWNAADDWEELNAYEGTGFRITSVGGTVGVLYVYGSTNGGYTYSPYSFRAPIFYDSNDTTYYGDFAGTSSLWGLAIRGDNGSTSTSNQIFFWGTGNTTTSAIGFKSNGGNFTNPTGFGDGYNTYLTMDTVGRGWVFRRGTGGSDFSAAYTSGWILNNGVWQSNGSMRAPIFYDSDDTGYYLDIAATGTALRLGGNIFANGSFGTNGYGSGAVVGRVFAPKGATFSLSAYANITGAIKIRLPQRGNDTMWSMKVRIYNYSTNDTSEYLLGNYSYSAGGYNYSASYLGGSSSSARNVRFGNEGGYDCVWIGETSTGWTHPVVSVMDFMGGYANGSCENWDDNWDINIVSSFGTIAATVSPAIRFGDVYSSSINSSNVYASSDVRGNDVYTTGGWFRNHTNNNGIYWSNTGWHIYPYDVADMHLRSGTSNIGLRLTTSDGNARGYIYADSDNQVGILTNDRNWALRINSSKTAYFHGGSVYIGWGQGSSNIFMYDSDETTRRIHCNSNRIGFLNSSDGWGSWCDNDGGWQSAASISAGGSMYSPNWFRSTGNTGWYNDTYSQGLRQSKGNVTYGNVIVHGENYNGWSGYNTNLNYITCFMQNSSGTHGWYQENGAGWTAFYNYGYACWGLGTDATDPSYSLHITKYGGSNTGWIIWSDRRIKENIKTIDNALDKVLALRGVYYNKIDDPTKTRQVGYIAQEVMEVVPELVVYSEELDIYNMNYAPMVGMLTEAIKEQQSQIETLKTQVQTLLTHINNGIQN